MRWPSIFLPPEKMDAVFTASLALPLFYLAFLYVYNIINVLFLSPIGRIPGDKLVIWNWLANMPKVVSGSLIFDLARQHRTHNSPIIFITADMISIADAKLAREILLNKDLPKSRLYDMLVQIHVNLFSTRDKVYHKTVRRKERGVGKEGE